jgi:HEAT repeat protein
MTVSSRLPAEPATPVEPVAEAPATSGRSITSIGYYSLTESTLKEDVKPTAAIEPAPAARRAYENVVKGELNTPSRSDPSPASTAQAQPATVRSEDVWSLIDDLERQDESSDLAAAALQRLGDPALRLVAYRFPGKLSHDRIGPQGELPAPSAHGPLVHFLVRVGAPAVPYLVELLGSENPEVRYYASFIFAELHAPQALAYLLERLFDSAPPVRRVTIEVLKVYREVPELRPVLEHLRAELVSPIPFRRRCAAEVLGALRDVEGVPRLIELTGDRDLEVSETAQRALLLITKQAFGDSRRRWRAWWERSLDNHRIVWLIEALGHKESECRFLAAQELHQLTGETLGYRFDQDKRDRDEAVSRWERWWETRGRVRFTGR